MLKILVYKFLGKHFMWPLGCCRAHREKSGVFLDGREEEVFTIEHEPGTSTVETLRKLVTELDKRGITDISGHILLEKEPHAYDGRGPHPNQVNH